MTTKFRVTVSNIGAEHIAAAIAAAISRGGEAEEAGLVIKIEEYDDAR